MTTNFSFHVVIGKNQSFNETVTINSIKPSEQDLYNAIDVIHDKLKNQGYTSWVRIVPTRTEYVFSIKQ